MSGVFKSLLEAISDACEAINEAEKRKEELKRKLRDEFETEEKRFNRGTVISVMADQNWRSWDMDKVLEKVSNPEQAEAAIGLIKSKKYEGWEIARILDKL